MSTIAVIPKLEAFGTTWMNVTVERGQYGNGDPAIQLFTVSEYGREELCTVSVNLEAYDIRPAANCIFVKDYAENEGIEAALVRAGIIELTGSYVEFGYVGANEARLLK